jgi:uncharacterized protein
MGSAFRLIIGAIMNIKDRSISKEFPEMKEQIQEMKKNNSHFAKMSDNYDAIEHSIHRIESGTESYTDEHLEGLKKKKLKLKDNLFSMLKAT